MLLFECPKGCSQENCKDPLPHIHTNQQGVVFEHRGFHYARIMTGIWLSNSMKFVKRQQQCIDEIDFLLSDDGGQLSLSFLASEGGGI